jgi:hypothetical protein
MRLSAALALSVSLAGVLGAAASATAYASASNENASEVKARAFADVRALDHHVLRLALDAVSCARDAGRIDADGDRLLTVIDYSKASTQPRLWVLDLERERLLFEELVAHGQGSGDNFPTRFSNREGSHQSVKALGRLGRSHGCPALRPAIARTVIDTIKDGSLVFAYYPDQGWLKGSRFLNGCS